MANDSQNGEKPITDGIVMALSIEGLQLGDDDLMAMGRAMIDLIRYHQHRTDSVVTCRASSPPCQRCLSRRPSEESD